MEQIKNILLIGSHSYVATSFTAYAVSYVPRLQWNIESISVRDRAWEKLSFQKYDCILYTAGIVHQKKLKRKENRRNYYQVNCNLAVKVAQKAIKDGVRQFIYISSMSVYGSVQGIIDQNTVPTPVNDYGKSKLMAEERLKKICANKIKLVICRPPMIYGKGCKGNYPKLSKLADVICVFPKIHNCRSQLYIDNMNEFLRNIIEKKEEGLYFPQNREYVCTSDLVEKIAQAKGKKVYLIPGFEKAFRFLCRKSGFLKKIFGSLVYKKSMSETKWEYQIKDWETSIYETEKGYYL